MFVKIIHAAQIKPWLLFTCNEEVGGLGAKNFCRAHRQKQLPNELDNLKFIIELDRKGSRDAVFYNCDNHDFEQYITGKGFKTAQGSFSDISLIAPELGVAAVNLSSGYHYAHTLHEHINRTELNATIDKVIDIINDVYHLSRFEYMETCPVIYHSQKALVHDKLISSSCLNEQNHIPHRIPAEFQDVYEALLDFYSVNELEYFRAEFGDNILWQIYDDEVNSFYHY